MKSYLKLFILLLLALVVAIPSEAQIRVVAAGSSAKTTSSKKKSSDNDEFKHIYTFIKDATFKRDIVESFIIPYDADGNPLDTIKTNGYNWNGTDMVRTSMISIPVTENDTLLMFDAGAPGFQTETVTWTFKPFGKRELSRSMPPVLLSKVHRLKDVTVTASKVKFYNRGDTVVYDADAFQLADGSMLDALISQLPGAKIDENGQITVNGEFVETLLLNGKDFFNDDKTLMLENIPAYTVKTVEVFKGHTKEEKLRFDQSKPQHLTMDIKLKKEYSIGWLLNLQAGYGTADRYLGRVFASWFSPTTSVVLTGLANNLNDNRTPGKSDSWTPESMPSGTQAHRELGVRYTHETTDKNLRADGSVGVSGGSTDYLSSTSSTQFLNSGDSYERRFNDSKSSRFSFNTFHSGFYTTKQQNIISYYLSGDYGKTDNYGNSLSGAFNRDYSDISREALEAIYTTGSTEALQAVVNRAQTRNEGSLRSGSFRFRPHFSLKLPNSSERINIGAGFNYVGSKRTSWNDYTINFGQNPEPSERRRQYTDESPNYRKEWSANIGYSRPLRDGFLELNYTYNFTDRAKDSYMYALDRLSDMGVFGVLPENYASTFDPTNSYTSTTRTNSHNLRLMYYLTKGTEKGFFMFQVMPEVGVDHHHFDYWRENRSYLVKRTSFVMSSMFQTLVLEYRFGKSKNDEGNHYNNTISYRGNLGTDSPELLHLVDVVSDADPLNIQEGNPDLKNAFTQRHNLQWSYRPYGKPASNSIAVVYSVISNALVRGYVYNTNTGVRRYRTYNVNGNNTLHVSDYLNWEFGSKKQFSFSSTSTLMLDHNTDMIGINAEAPEKAKVRNMMLTEDLRLSYKIGQQQLTLQGNLTHRHTTSERQDFNTINAQHYKYGVNGIFKLPAGFGISTDISFYKRVGYGVKELDSTDAVWNMRLTYTPRGNKHWVFSADGFDLLHKLSNVHYAVTATGRTVSYTNSLPRYMVFTVQYRLNIQPKK